MTDADNSGALDTMDIEEAAKYLKASVRTVYGLAAQGALPGSKVGRRWVFVRRDLANYLLDRYAIKVMSGVKDENGS